MNLVKWDKVILRKKQRELGIKILRKHSRNHLQKWQWRLNTKDRNLWRTLISHTYGMLNQWTTNEVKSPYGSSVWRIIRRKKWRAFWGNVEIAVDDGKKMITGKINGLVRIVCKSNFPVLYSVSNQNRL